MYHQCQWWQQLECCPMEKEEEVWPCLLFTHCPLPVCRCWSDPVGWHLHSGMTGCWQHPPNLHFAIQGHASAEGQQLHSLVQIDLAYFTTEGLHWIHTQELSLSDHKHFPLTAVEEGWEPEGSSTSKKSSQTFLSSTWKPGITSWLNSLGILNLESHCVN